MFGFRKTLDTITLFAKPGSAASNRVVTLLKQVSANSSASATVDQASDHSAQTSPARREEFNLDVTEDPPTTDQLQTILGYVGSKGIASIVEGAGNEQEALKKFRANPDAFKRPVVVDWSSGKAQAGDNESEILKMLGALNKK